MSNRSTPTRCEVNGCARRSVRGFTLELCAEHRQTVVNDLMSTGADLARCYWPGCRAYCTEGIRICGTHLAIAGYYAMKSDSIRQQVIRMGALPTLEAKPKTKAAEKPGVVYYLRSGGYIKIGWTSNLEQRMRAYPPDTVLLAVRPGTRADESATHRRFSHLTTHGREWFPLAPQISEHIDKVLAENGPPPAVEFAARKSAPATGQRQYVGGPNRGKLAARQVRG